MKDNLIAPVNTERLAREHPFLHLAEAMSVGSSNAILAEEARGQRQAAGSDTLPAKISPEDQAALESWGFEFLGPVEGDSLFQFIKMPAGWTKKPTSHSLYTDLVDPQGRVRGSIGYKAAFYDRWAQFHLVRRFAVRRDYARGDKDGVAVSIVEDCGVVIFTTSERKLPAERKLPYYAVGDAADEEAKAWLKEHWPLYESAAEYWS